MSNIIIYWLFVVIFWLSAITVFYSYVVFPLLISILAKKKQIITKQFEQSDSLPYISVLISAYNEYHFIEKKINSVLNTNYPLHKIEILVGSDASTDGTNKVLEKLSKKHHQLLFIPFEKRKGKANVINELYKKTKGDILILTDANVMLDKNTIYELVKYFKDESVGLVDSKMINTNIYKNGISKQEKAYITREVYIKNNESILWGSMMGPFGGCFAIKKDLYSKVPSNFLVDDFYINMKVLEKGYKCINNLDAKVYEDIPNNLSDEFRRKVRIATGNFQNLKTFHKLLFKKSLGLTFSFISHKILRWLGPFFIILAIGSNIILSTYNNVYFFLLVIHCIIILLPLIDYILKRMSINITILRFITHFYSMNVALLIGFLKSFKKIKTNVWKPTKRSNS